MVLSFAYPEKAGDADIGISSTPMAPICPQNPVFQAPGDNVLDSIEDLLLRKYKTLRRFLSRTGVAPSWPGTICKLWSRCVCHRPKGLLPRRRPHMASNRRVAWL